jgi:hypothetical protein
MATCRVCKGNKRCTTCNGNGSKGGVIRSSCPTCKGKRYCFACDGKGWRN